ncbi:hypothetical protein M8009_02820 [Halomonas sp. ATCH28]|uniref:Serine acetyltransferase n=1 Tax=Halomonas gemina TaxID=2945105 RepID=A0ABT0SXB6_9GAMM|nr:hypothetical protein [Halomonas gemina]MCL7939237.1 hypothetical protein [Halomonas gemina]
MLHTKFLDTCTCEVLGGKPRWVYLRLLKVLFSRSPSRQSVLYIRLVQLCSSQGWSIIANWAQYRLVTSFGLYVHPRAEIGKGLRLPHPTSIVLGGGLQIGERCLIYQQVTVGAAPRNHDGLMQRVGDDVTLYPGAKFVGRGRVGNRVVVGANALVADEFGDDVVVAGVPARVIRSTRAGDRVGAVHRL